MQDCQRRRSDRAGAFRGGENTSNTKRRTEGRERWDSKSRKRSSGFDVLYCQPRDAVKGGGGSLWGRCANVVEGVQARR
ncbi:hypothetical protein LX36DRAFT_224724 [Colletotrichum falcatum]|nr:hypothetical protein LX36DRAFT_224724 [Colletotrichum falcatum]